MTLSVRLRDMLGIFFSFALLLQAYAETYPLYTRTRSGMVKRSPEYSKIIENLKAGDEIIFETHDNRTVTFKIKVFLGQGATTKIFALEGGYAIRIPYGTQDMMNHTLEGYRILKGSGAPMPRILTYSNSQYAVVDEIKNIEFGFMDFFMKNEKIDASMLQEMEDALVEFSKKIAIFNYIGDFHQAQIRYDSLNKTWVLLDWSSGSQLAFKFDESSQLVQTGWSSPIGEAFWRILSANLMREGIDYDHSRLQMLETKIREATETERIKILNGSVPFNPCSRMLKK